MKVSAFVKTLFYFTLVFVTVFLIIFTRDVVTYYKYEESHEQVMEDVKTMLPKDVKYILMWTLRDKNMSDMDEGQSEFIQRNCSRRNCYITTNKTFLSDYMNFDVIAFTGLDISSIKDKNALPQRRSPHQKYVLAMQESSHHFPVCHSLFDGFINWTWTYKLESDLNWGYVVVRDKNQNIIGPSKVMHWKNVEDMSPISEELKEKLNSKSKAAAWFASNCKTPNLREKMVEEVQKHLDKYDLKVDIFGVCGQFICPENNMDNCMKVIEKDYYFYFAFENSFSEDYVTEKLLYALKHNAVPVVFGGANYTRFMPDGIYLNARELGAEKLADTMNEIIEDPERYYQFFRWKNHYSYHNRDDSVETDHLCTSCAMLNNEKLVKKVTVYENITKWWTPPNRCQMSY